MSAKKSNRTSFLPTVVCEDITAAGIANALAARYPSVVLNNDESATLVGGYAMSRDQILNFAGNLCSFWDGEVPQQIRAHSIRAGTRGRRFSMHLMMQEYVADRFVKDPMLWVQGLMTRCLIAVAPSVDQKSLPQNTDKIPSVKRYHAAISALLKISLPIRAGTSNELCPRELKLTSNAKALLTDFLIDVQERKAPGGPFAGIRGTASKAAQQASRLAAVLTLISTPSAMKIHSSTIRQACNLLEYYLSQARVPSPVSGSIDPDIALAVKTLDWLRGLNKTRVTRQRIYQFGPAPIRSVAKTKAVMDILIKYGWARSVRVNGEKGYELRQNAAAPK